MTDDKALEKKLMQSFDELEDKINLLEDSSEKSTALDALEKARQLLNLN